MNRATRISYVLVFVVLAMVAWLHLGTFLLTCLFGYLALQIFHLRPNKWVSVTLYLITVAVLGSGLVYFSGIAYRTLPRVAEAAIPAMVGFAERNGIDLPFTDYASLKTTALYEAREGFAVVGRYAGAASFQIVYMVAGLVVALSIFVGSGWTADRRMPVAAGSVFEAVTQELTLRFRSLYESFAKVMGAQVVISAINTLLTAAFLGFNHYPHTGLLAGLVFQCGLIPIVGNILSNIVVVGVGFTISARTGISALVFLVLIHKLEYFLNSKIIGTRINSPMWLTLIGLLVGEKLMGISGMILAPVVLHFMRVEGSRFRMAVEPDRESVHG